MEQGVVLILGASGFLGPHLVAACGRARRSAVAAARDPARAPRRDGVETRAWDGTLADDTARLIDAVRPRGVVLAAALSRVDDCERDPELARELNAALPERVARTCARRQIRLLHVSTDLVFGVRAPRGERFDEEDPPGPVHAYGRSKAEGEERVLSVHPRALVVRLPLLYGDSGGRGLGATDQILACLERGERPALFTDEWRTPLAVGNAAQALIELVSLESSGLEVSGLETSGILHVAGPERLSRHALGLALLRARGEPAEQAALRLRAVTRAERGLAELRPADVSLDASRARAILATPLLAPARALAFREPREPPP